MSADEVRIDEMTTELSDALRRWLRARPEPHPFQAGALAYELAALIARHAESLPVAYRLVDSWNQIMKEQIAEFGIGHEHP